MTYGKSGARGAIVAALALGALTTQSCSEKQSLVLVSLTATPAESGLDSVTIDVSSISRTFMIPTGGLGASAVSFGVYVPESLTGTQLVGATARAGSAPGCYQGQSNVTIASAGVTATVTVPLMPSKSCGGGSGAAGSGSGMGTAGMAGTMGGGGVQGVAGTQGGAGTMGMAGTMGTAGAAGMAGAAGTMGTAGAAGGTAGMAGTMGSAGAGMAGTMGTAGVPMVVDPPSLTKCSEISHTGTSATCEENDPDDWAVWSVTFSRDGKLLLTSGEDGKVKVWSMNGSTATAEGHVIQAKGQAYVGFSPDGKALAVGSGIGQLTLHNTTTWAVTASLTGLVGHIEGVGFTADGTQVVAADADTANPTMAIYTVGSTAAPRKIPLPDAAYTLAVSPVKMGTAQWVAVGYSDGFADLIDINNPQSLPTEALKVTSDAGQSLAYSTFSLAFNPTGTLLATGGEDGVTSFWAVPRAGAAGPIAPAITTEDNVQNPQGANGVAFSPDGRFVSVAAGSFGVGGKIGLWDSVQRSFRGSFVPTYFPRSVAFSPNGKIIAAGQAGCGVVAICAD